MKTGHSWPPVLFSWCALMQNEPIHVKTLPCHVRVMSSQLMPASMTVVLWKQLATLLGTRTGSHGLKIAQLCFHGVIGWEEFASKISADTKCVIIAATRKIISRSSL